MPEFRKLEGDLLPSLAFERTKVVEGWLVSGNRLYRNLYALRVQLRTFLLSCPKCGVFGQLILYGYSQQSYADTPMYATYVQLLVKRQRYRCKACEATSMQPLPWAHEDRRATRRLVEAIEQDCLTLSNIQTARKYGVDDKTVRNIQDSLVERLEREVTFETPEWLGIDELYIASIPRAVFTNIREETLIEMLEDRNKSTIIPYLATLDARNVRVVAMDMWRPYRDAVNEVLPQATVVVDKFHVVRMANRGLEKVRIEHGKRLSAERRSKLRGNRRVLLKRRKRLTDAEVVRIDLWGLALPELLQAYRLKERFYGIYDASTALEARRRYARWLASVPEELKARGGPWYDLVTAMANWEPEIMAYFEHRVTNAFTESKNRVIRDINRGGNGLSFRILRAKAIYGPTFRKEGKLASPAKLAKLAFRQSVPHFLMSWRPRERAFDLVRAEPNIRKVVYGADIHLVAAYLREAIALRRLNRE